MADDVQVINVPGIGPVNFPASMSDADITAAIQKNIGAPKSAGTRALESSKRALNYVVGDDPARQFAIGSHALAKGAMYPMNALMDLPMQIRNQILGEQNQMPSKAFDPATNMAGAVGTEVPTPQTHTEQMAAAANEGGGAALSFGAGAVPAAGASLPQALGATARSGVIGSVASEWAKQNGLPWWAQIAAGMAAPSGFDLAKLGVKGVYQTVAPPNLGGASPYTQGGREMAAGNVLARNTTAPAAVINRLEADPTIVSGVTPRTAQVADDTGMAQLDKLLQTTRPQSYGAEVSNMEGANNRVLREAMDKIVPAEVASKAQEAANATTAARNAMLQTAPPVTKASAEAIVERIDRLMDSKLAMQEDAVRPALDMVRKRMFDTKGNLITDPDLLDGVRQYVSRMIAGNFDQPAGVSFSKANQALHEVLDGIRGTINSSVRKEDFAPLYTPSLRETAQAMKPIEQRSLLTEILEKGSSKADILPGGAGATGENYRVVLSQVNKALANERMASKVDRVLTDEQLNGVAEVVKELERGARLTSMQRNRLGSDTMQNLSSAALFGRVLGIDLPPSVVAAAPDYVQKTLGWIANLGGGPQERTVALVEAAMKDPKLAAELLKKAPAANLESFGQALGRKTREYGAGGAIGAREQ